MNIWSAPPSKLSRLGGPPLRSWAGRHSRLSAPLSLIHRKPKLSTPPPPAPVYQTIHQTVIHLAPVTHQHILHKTASIHCLSADAFLLLMPPAAPLDRRGLEPDPSRPTRTVQRLRRIFSMDSVQRQLRPFYRDIVRGVLKEEQERYQSRPTQAISLIWNLFGRQQAFRTLTRFYLSAVEKLGSHYYPALHGQNALYLAAGVVLHSQVYQRYVRQLWRGESGGLPLRYAHHQQAMTDDLLSLQVARRTLPPQKVLEEIAPPRQQEPSVREPVRAGAVHLSQADFRALVQGVADSLGRQARLESLRRGGI